MNPSKSATNANRPHGNCRVCGEATANLARFGRKIKFLCVRCSTAIRTGEAK